MDINSIGSVTRLPGLAPTAAQTQQHPVRENFAAPGKPQDAQTVSAPSLQNPASAEARNDLEQDKRQNLQDSVEALNEFIKPQNTSLAFSIDDENGTVVVKVTDKETKEVIKQFPSEEALELAKALDKLKGLLVQQKV